MLQYTVTDMRGMQLGAARLVVQLSKLGPKHALFGQFACSMHLCMPPRH